MENTNTKCPLCNAACKTRIPKGAADIYDCPFCGCYLIPYASTSMIESEFQDKKHIIAGFLGEINKNNHTKPYQLDSDSVKLILSDARIPKSIMQKLEKFLYYCYLEYDFIGQEFTLNESHKKNPHGYDRKNIIIDANRTNISYIAKKELKGIIYAMSELNWVNATPMNNPDIIMYFSLTTQGLCIAEQIVQSNKNSNNVFVAIEYHNDYKERLNTAIFPACDDCGFNAFILSDTEHNNNINDEMFVDIKRSKFIIADLTNNNLGTYYEAGYAEGIGIPVIKCCSQEWFPKIHFDINHDNFVIYTDFNDYKDKLKKRIRRTISNAVLED